MHASYTTRTGIWHAGLGQVLRPVACIVAPQHPSTFLQLIKLARPLRRNPHPVSQAASPARMQSRLQPWRCGAAPPPDYTSGSKATGRHPQSTSRHNPHCAASTPISQSAIIRAELKVRAPSGNAKTHCIQHHESQYIIINHNKSQLTT